MDLIKTNNEKTPAALIMAAVQREIAEVQASMMLAKQMPRDVNKALERIMVTCQRESLAEVAIYTYARGGTNIQGASIRLAEAIAQQWGNMNYGIKELEQREGESTVEAFAWDLETNTKQSKIFQVKHERHTKNGVTKLTDPRDIYEHVANNGARRLRACILGVIPGDIVESAVNQCQITLTTQGKVTPEKIKNMLAKFAELGVTEEMIKTRIQRKPEAITAAQMASLGQIYNSIKDEMSKAADWFDIKPQSAAVPETED